MPIGDLLASIEGKPSVPSTKAPARPGNGIPAKRKAEDDARASEQKQPRLGSNANGSARSTGDAFKASRPAERSSSGYTGSARSSTTATSNTPRPLTEKSASAASKKPALTTSGKPSPTTPTFPIIGRSATSTSSSLSRPASTSRTASSDGVVESTAKAPKKGSYAEIKARAAAQAQKLQTIGKIQHRAVEKQPTKKEQDAAAAEDARLAKKGGKPGSRPAAGLPSKNGSHPNGNGVADRGGKGLGPKGVAARAGAKVAAVEERKPKKSALATTGYAGSARPAPSKGKPGAASSDGGRDRGRDRNGLNPLGMFSQRRRRDEEYDEELDDFIDDDEEEPEEDPYGYGRRYRYADEESDSDMEAGYSDVEDEEAAAARQARLEDQREEALLERRRREKEARKRAAGAL
ncbi:hypothetical protein N8I77_003295 [Diaporthe amygdali]|uniref:SPT2 chromatin protein n=1 Tax=Phomopsis amygdali TaxID=1214568 RepID=A0AAD9SJH2_PHOAM|nr:hypothetical protein N8I77_003295 [Diaporthe amygdali]